jgi:ketosteroid isomerase-like protein
MKSALVLLAGSLLLGTVSGTAGIKSADLDETAHLIDLDRQFQSAVKEQDAVTAGKFLADDYELTTSSGKVYSKQAFLATLDPKNKMQVNVSREVKVRIHGDVAILAAILDQAYMENGKLKSAPVRFTDTYLKTPTGWLQIAAHASTYSGR